VRSGTNRQARLGYLALGKERREVAALRALGWRELDGAVAVFAAALPHLDAFVRSHARARRERLAYDRLLVRWQARAAASGLDLCGRFGFAY
jgi:hypothetical protein